MPRKSIPFTSDSIARALKGAKAAGSVVRACEVCSETGNIILRFDEDSAPVAPSAQDEAEEWFAAHANG